MRMLPRALALAPLAVVACATDLPDAPDPADGAESATFEFPELEIEVPSPEVLFRVPPSPTYVPDTPGKPSLWQARSGAASLYLYGAIDADDAALDARAGEAYARAEEIVLGTDHEGADAAQVRALAARYGTLEPPDSLESLLPAETWAQLVAALARGGRSVESFRSMQPWLASLALAGDGLAATEGEADALTLRPRGGGDAKPVVGLETPESRFRTLAALPLPVQTRLLRETLAPAGDSPVAPASVVEAWRRGDAGALSALLDPPDREAALLYEQLIYRPNERMAARLDAMATDGKPRFVALSLIHLVGERGVPALLAGRGYRVERLE